MKRLLLFMFLTASIYAGFDFKTCSGSGTFEQQINHYHGHYENAITVGTIPKGIKGLQINLISDKDVDIRLYAENGDKIVHWPHGILNKSYLETKPYKKTNITYSGYNGVAGKQGHEFIEINGTLSTAMTMKAFGYKAGYARVNYSWKGKEGCKSNQNGSGFFTQKILENKTNLVGTIPAGIENLHIKLTSEKDVDVQLYGEDGTAIVSWKPKGLIYGPNEDNITHHKMNIFWSGYNGTQGEKGHEYIKIPNKTSETLTMKVFGYEAGDANVTYSWGHKGTCIEWFDGCNGCFIDEDNQITCTTRYCEVYEEYKCTKWKDDNTSQPSNYVCGANTLIDCPEENQTCNLKTFKNLDELNKNVNYTFQYNGKCKKDTNITGCTKEYAPVCGITNPCPPGAQCLVAPIYKTFGNMCMLEVENAEFAYEGECNNTTQTKKEILYVSEESPVCLPMPGIKCPTYLTKKTANNSWENFYDEIKGFNYKSHHRYKLSIETKNIPNPPADGSSTEYKLLKILEDTLIVEKGCIAWYDGCNSCFSETSDSTQAVCTEMACQVYGEYKCTQWKDDNSSTNVQQDELTKNIKLWKQKVDNSDYQFSVDGFFSYGPNKWTTIVKEGNASVLTGKIKIGGAKTIMSHFNFIQSLIDDDTVKLTKITYDSTYGYPTEIKWTAVAQEIVGLWGSYKINNFKLLENTGVCMTIVEPVCAQKKYAMLPQTYSNACFAKLAGATVLYQGACTNSYEKNIIIKPNKVECQGLFVVPGTKCLQIQEEGSNIWQTILGVKNFNYQEHYKYKIFAKITESPKNLMDAPPKFYELIKVLKKDFVEDINSYEKVITIKPKKVDCFALYGSWTQCMVIQEEGSNTWQQIYVPIEKLTYKEGYEYKILAKITPPQSGMVGAITHYKLIKILEKNKVSLPQKEYAPVCVNLAICSGKDCMLDNPLDNYKTFENIHKFELYEVSHPKSKLIHNGKCNKYTPTLVCGEKFYTCPPGKICIALESMEVTYKNMDFLKLENAKFLHKGPCDTSYSSSK